MLARFNKEIFSKKNAAFGYVWTRLVLPLRRECCVGLRIHEDDRHLKQKLAKVGSSRQQPRPPLSWPTTGPPPTPFPLLQVSLGRFPSCHLMSPVPFLDFIPLQHLAATYIIEICWTFSQKDHRWLFQNSAVSTCFYW